MDMHGNIDLGNDLPDWMKDTEPVSSSSITSVRRDNENSRLLKRQSISRNNGRVGRESLGAISPSQQQQQQQHVTNEYDDDDDDIECFGSFFDPILAWFYAFHTLSLLCGLSCTFANIYIIMKSTSASSLSNNDISIRDIIIRLYTIICCLLIVISEMDWRYIMHRFRILDLWLFRGFFYVFVGFLTLSDGPLFKYGSIQPQDIVGSIQIGMGFMYVIFGLMCVKSIKLQHLSKYEKKHNNNNSNNSNPINDQDFVSV